jgi:hypothetical protein
MNSLSVRKKLFILRQQIFSNFLGVLQINSIEQNPSWEADSHSASQEISRLLWNSKVHCRVPKSPQTAHMLSQMNPVHILPHYSLKIHFNIILPPTPMYSEWSLPFRLSYHDSVRVSHHPHAPSISSSLKFFTKTTEKRFCVEL